MNIDICVCTFRRPYVAETLKSLAHLSVKPEWKIRIIVADNDDKPSAKPFAEQAGQNYGLDILYIHAPARNISIARNACLDNATAPYIAFIDDDETALPGWLEGLVDEMENTHAAAVLGPVLADYEKDAPDWIRNGDFHSTKPVWVRGQIITGYTCNLLLRRNAIGDLRFEKKYGRSGGEDTVFLSTLFNAGGRIAFAPDAVVNEIVGKERACARWLFRRRFRAGQTYALILMERDGTGLFARAVNISIAAGKMAFCYIAALPNLVAKVRACYWLLRGTMHAGVIARLCGRSEIENYG